MHSRQDLSLFLSFSGRDLDNFREEGIPPSRLRRRNAGPVQPRKLWVCLEIISEKSKQVSSIQQITHDDRSQVEFGNMTILAEADDRCRLHVLLSTSKKKPSKPGMIMGEWFFNFQSLTAYAVYKQGLTLKMKHKNTLVEVSEHHIGTLRFTITHVPTFNGGERGQNILEQFPEPHPSNLSPGIFTTPSLSQTKSPGISTTPDFSSSKKRLSLSLSTVHAPAPESPALSSVLDLNLTFKEPDEIEKPEPRSVRQVFRGLKKELRLLIFVGVRHPARYIRDRRQVS